MVAEPDKEKVKEMAVRCKFRVTSKELFPKNDQCERPTKVKLYPVTGGAFGKYTPSGSMEMLIQNDEAEAQLEVGKEYYIDITEA
jgi:hypothetical protein